MTLNLSLFYRLNVTDTCAVWNILSSRLLHMTAKQAGITFCCTKFVLYECLFKPRKTRKPEDRELRDRLREAQTKADFMECQLDIADLQTVELLGRRKHLGKGELSSLALAMKINQALMTDDQKARRLGILMVGNDKVQTTPHLLGWLLFEGRLTDVDKDDIIAEHKRLGGILEQFYEEVYHEAMRCRLMMRG